MTKSILTAMALMPSHILQATKHWDELLVQALHILHRRLSTFQVSLIFLFFNLFYLHGQYPTSIFLIALGDEIEIIFSTNEL